jgi:hypothetical protein
MVLRTAPDGKYYANFGEDASWGPVFDPNQLVYQWILLLPVLIMERQLLGSS